MAVEAGMPLRTHLLASEVVGGEIAQMEEDRALGGWRTVVCGCDVEAARRDFDRGVAV